MFRPWLLAGAILMASALAVSPGCGDDDGGATRFVGAILLPPAEQCGGCNNANVPVGFSALRKDAPPEPIAQVATDAQGNYATGDLEPQLGARRAVIVVANVAPGTGIGGVESASRDTNDKDFDVGTQVACVASVFLTQGTSGAGDPGCAVRSACGPGDPFPCFDTIDPSLVDNERIEFLERAADVIEGRVTLPGDQNRAACAAINCTFGGSGPASAECMNGAF